MENGASTGTGLFLHWGRGPRAKPCGPRWSKAGPGPTPAVVFLGRFPQSYPEGRPVPPRSIGVLSRFDDTVG
jgi:hypothetical protein